MFKLSEVTDMFVFLIFECDKSIWLNLEGQIENLLFVWLVLD